MVDKSDSGIEVTPEMIRAGEDAVFDVLGEEELLPGEAAKIARGVYRAMTEDYLDVLRRRREVGKARGYKGSDLHAFVTLGFEPIPQGAENPRSDYSQRPASLRHAPSRS